MNKEQLKANLVDAGHFSTKKAAGECIDHILSVIEDTVATGTDVRLAGFGKFELYTRTNGTKTPKFRPFDGLKSKVA